MPPGPRRLLLLVIVVLVTLVRGGAACHQRKPPKDVSHSPNPRMGREACYLLPLKTHKRVLRETTRPFGECQNSTIDILVDGRFRCVQTMTGRMETPADAMSCPDDGVLYMLGINHIVGTHMAARPAELHKRLVCYQLRRPEKDPLFWRTHLEATDMGFYYCKALYGFGTARVALYLVSDPDNVRKGFCLFAGSVADVPRTVDSRWCQLSVGGAVALRAWTH